MWKKLPGMEFPISLKALTRNLYMIPQRMLSRTDLDKIFKVQDTFFQDCLPGCPIVSLSDGHPVACWEVVHLHWVTQDWPKTENNCRAGFSSLSGPGLAWHRKDGGAWVWGFWADLDLKIFTFHHPRQGLSNLGRLSRWHSSRLVSRSDEKIICFSFSPVYPAIVEGARELSLIN